MYVCVSVCVVCVCVCVCVCGCGLHMGEITVVVISMWDAKCFKQAYQKKGKSEYHQKALSSNMSSDFSSAL